MNTLTSREQFRLLEIELVADSGSYSDYSNDLAEDPVTIEEVAFGIDSLKFTIVKRAESLLNSIQRAMRVRFKGGYLFGRQEWIFDGRISSWKPHFPDSGQVRLEVTAYSALWLLTRRKPGCVYYPSIPFPLTLYTRVFHFGTSIKLSAIVKGIIAEYSADIKLGSFSIPKERDFEFTLYNPVVQNEDESDFDFVARLLRGRAGTTDKVFHNWLEEAQRHGHAVFFSETKGSGAKPETVFHVIPEADLVADDNKTDISFVFHRKDSDTPLVNADTYVPDADDARIPIHDVSVEENQDAAEGYTQLVIKEAANSKKKKKKGNVPVLQVGVSAETEETPEEAPEKDEPPDGWFAWEPDLDAIRKAREAGELKDLPTNPIDLFNEIKKSWPWSRAKKYFRPRET
ncbi:hypothetical protein KW797_02195, partial [Candidatus Parcubacteria bacterium]|nr:hypothetical protein [Candidatus Parcubacteria bacterium]